MTPTWCIDDPVSLCTFHRKFIDFSFCWGMPGNNRCICYHQPYWFPPFSCYNHSLLGHAILCYYPCIGSLPEDVSIELLGSLLSCVTIDFHWLASILCNYPCIGSIIDTVTIINFVSLPVSVTIEYAGSILHNVTIMDIVYYMYYTAIFPSFQFGTAISWACPRMEMA